MSKHQWSKLIRWWDKGWLADYQQVYFGYYPHLFGKVVVHHAIEKDVLEPDNQYYGMFARDYIHGIENLRGVIKGGIDKDLKAWIINHRMHLSAIRLEWNQWYLANPRPGATVEDFEAERRRQDEIFGWMFAERAGRLPPDLVMQHLAALTRIAETLYLPKRQTHSDVDWFLCDPNCPPRRAPESPGTAAQRFFEGAGAGGVDFTSLELRYISDRPVGESTNEVSYAFSARSGSGGGTSALQGLRNADLASDAFFVWLALPASDFWVNLNPNEPHRIIEEEFGRTDAGRVLLEADLALKKSVARLTDPRRPTGRRFWSQLVGREKCVSMRQWIVPSRADVRATDEELHILRAPLRVKMETEYLDDKGTGSYKSCPRQSTADERHNERVYRKLILPRVEHEVNHGDRYAPLRRVYLSRVAAEWVRERHGYQRTAYDAIIGSGHIGRWVSRSKWKPTDTYRAYVRSYRDHEYEVTDSYTVGSTRYTLTYVFGGVDFASVPRHNLSKAAFDRDYGQRVAAVRRSIEGATIDPISDQVLIGGTTTVRQPETSQLGREGDVRSGGAPWWQMVLIGFAVAVLYFLRLLLGPGRRAR